MLTREKSIQGVLFSSEEIQTRVRDLGQQISTDYANLENPLILIGILNGSFVLCADLMRQITIPVEIHFMSVSSYGSGTESTGIVRIDKDLRVDITGRDVLIVEDIVDTGLTLSYLRELFADRQPKSLEICAFLDKPETRQKPVEVRYIGFSIPNEFVVGYGLDYNHYFRELPYIAILKSEVYQG
ncbi:hypoxanthine phosphoribosyltransferase [Candidatus Parcubacteria bacterium]|nr:MAG: hypoxanthine phosphoribosyltransferase [Candidatus Parcubacteria bacterium]